MSSVRVDGAELHYTRVGQGPACVVPCALGTTHYELLTADLAGQFSLVLVDLRGSGRSTGSPAELTFDVLARDIEAVRAQVGVAQWSVLGYSIAGALAIEYARRCPDTVSHVVVAGTPPHGDMGRLAQLSAAFFEATAPAERKQIFAENLAKLPPGTDPRMAIPAQTPMRFFDPRFDVMPLLTVIDFKPAFFAQLMGPLIAGWDVTAGTPLRVPLLVAHGRHDYVVPHTMWGGVLPQLPTASFQLFECSGHQPFFEEPQRFAQVVTEWMGHASAGRAQ
jgi:proline iminopeptidase